MGVVERGFGDRSDELNGGLTVFNYPLGIGWVDLVDRHSMNRRQIIGVMIANRLFDLRILFSSGFEQQSIFGLLLDLAIPNVEALNLADLYAGDETAIDQITGHCMGNFEIVDRSSDGDRIHDF